MCECVEIEDVGYGPSAYVCEACYPDYLATLKYLRAGFFRRLWWRLFGDPLDDIFKDVQEGE